MAEFNLSADIREVNRYDFVINAKSKDDARKKLIDYLEKNIPIPFHGDIDSGVTCIDREVSMVCEKVLTIKY